MKELIRVRVQYASRQQCCKTHKRPLTFTFTIQNLTVKFTPFTISKCEIYIHIRFTSEGRTERHFTWEGGEKYSVRSISGFIPFSLIWQLHENEDFVKTGSRSTHCSNNRHNIVPWFVSHHICFHEQSGTYTTQCINNNTIFSTKYH